MTEQDEIIIRGAREHNLQDINLSIPKNKLVVFCGVSGSGKSSLAFDTLFAEGQRRYVESLSTYARQFLGIAPKPDVDQIKGLSPAIAIDQKGLSHNPRSTVGTVTEIYDYLRLLFAKAGNPVCPSCGRPIERQTPLQVAKQISEQATGLIASEGKARFLIMSPVVRDKRGEFTKLFQNLLGKGFRKARIDGHFYGLNEDIFLIRTNRHNIDLVIDKINLSAIPKDQKEFLGRLTDSVEMAFELSEGLAILSRVEDVGFDFPEKPKKTTDQLFSRRFSCPACRISLPPILPRLFSFNSPLGACSRCRGLGSILKVDPNRVSYHQSRRIEAQFFQTESDFIRKKLESLMIRETCPDCLGGRLNKEALSVLIDSKNISHVSGLALDEFSKWISGLLKKIEEVSQKEVVEIIIREIESRINFLIAVGVDYLSLSRDATSLSTGEAQRIRLASQLGTGLTGVLYILDEPTVGLHPRDTGRLIDTLKDLRDLGNTVIVVEHDQSVLESADFLVEFGPGAGKEGGKIVTSGLPGQFKKNTKSLTAAYLSGRKKVKKAKNKKTVLKDWLTLRGCRQYNLKNLTVKFPLKTLTVVAGVSGSGKSTLIEGTLYPALSKTVYGHFHRTAGDYDSIDGSRGIERILVVDQSPIGKTSRSNPATYIGVFDDIRDLFALTKEAKVRGFTKSQFSFNVEGGRCPRCQGQGAIQVKMEFLPDVWVACEECNGSRFKESVLDVDYKDKSIADVLKMTVDEAAEFFANHRRIFPKLALLKEIGLGYLELGQISPTLSGGESQRLKLARELVKRSNKQMVYLLDEPTTGLHFADLEKLLTVLRKLVDAGHTVVVIEHNPEIIRQADWIVELGPEGGGKGGYLIAQGTPEQIKKNKDSVTGRFI
ncbi:MAG: excinuclease ABC subunit UvrA [Patescibacteria group bacterium]|nr:excinuclease ABC subunit UvrA [Patescibacteria group bacterium]